jgi:hypothetical protein
MNDLSIVYFKNDSVKDEIKIDNFWLELKKEIYEAEEDNSVVRVNTRRMHQSAFAGDYAGIFIEIAIAGIPLIDATLNIWEKIVNHLNDERNKNKVVRVNNLTTLENLCKVDLIIQKNIKNATIFNSKIITENYEIEEGLDNEFIYEGKVNTEVAAEISFENKKNIFIYKIQTDGNIVEFQKISK